LSVCFFIIFAKLSEAIVERTYN